MLKWFCGQCSCDAIFLAQRVALSASLKDPCLFRKNAWTSSKRSTLGKLSGVRCATSAGSLRKVNFMGSTLQTMTIRMSGCCDALIAMANQKIAGQ